MVENATMSLVDASNADAQDRVSKLVPWRSVRPP